MDIDLSEKTMDKATKVLQSITISKAEEGSHIFINIPLEPMMMHLRITLTNEKTFDAAFSDIYWNSKYQFSGFSDSNKTICPVYQH